ncbi:MAG TPA: hypothetical protein ENN97_10785 [Phycisphaerales bacterium]|nr:hypothetical protein [Phycisphaerales bacterium]
MGVFQDATLSGRLRGSAVAMGLSGRLRGSAVAQLLALLYLKTAGVFSRKIQKIYKSLLSLLDNYLYLRLCLLVI